MITVLLGVVLVCLHSVTTHILIMVMGCILIATGVINFLVSATGKTPSGEKRSPGTLSIISSIACVVLGLWWVIEPGTNAMIIVRLIGALAILSGIYRIYNMKVTFGDVKFPAVLYVLPVLIIGCGVVMEIWPEAFANILVMLVGIVLIVYGVAALCQAIRIKSYTPVKSSGEVEDVVATEVNDEKSAKTWPTDR